ncbi:hypothetical protein CfE428DRAFT_5814 [Chthoniobacter flavus Ellin428]|uniref:Uncharacterized protein n=1 Tax=Chthoniobacter flavus Ellin428 TaxID=497964 RepID=B4DA74_9BACT|nr:hypothetical protein [Chthoniobacter flavus]EDY16701.1 hypothetical protein CfE428DRAFT_5814 [Chthoniobacter flavus Ellin428]
MSKILIALFRSHANDPLSFLIKARTAGSYVHAAVVVDPATNTIIEAYYPHVRQRQLADSELNGIDFFEIEGLTDAQADQVIAYCQASVAAMTPYSVEDLFRFEAPIRAIAGDASDSPALNVPKFCSMFAFCAVRTSGFVLLNAHDYEVDPSKLAWAPAMHMVAPLQPLTK